MATINDYKIISKKSHKYFDLLQIELKKKLLNIDQKGMERIGFYLFILENLTNEKEISHLTEMITDTEFNKVIYGKSFDDCGVDAVYINEEDNTINLYNFKYREKFKVGKQSVNETILTTKFINALVNEDTSSLKEKTKIKADLIIDKLINSNEEWGLKLYVVSNEDFDLENIDHNLSQLEKAYGLEIISIGLNRISEFTTLRPSAVNAELILDIDAIMSFSESSISSSTSYILRLPITEVIRITCNNKELRNNYSLENISELKTAQLEYSVLFDNVRGLVLKSKFNNGISKTLKEEPSRFFMYNNGLTLTAQDITATHVNANKKVRLSIKSIQVLNGGQTLRTIYSFNSLDPKNIEDYLSNSEILVRVFKTSEDNTLNNNIAEYTNSQNSISNIDLKSLRSEQLHLEQYLDEYNIIYSRKSGDTGLSENKHYKHKISMERFGQILFSLKGFPEKASTQKKQVFDKYYEKLFGEDNLTIEDSPNQVSRYLEVKKNYEELEHRYDVSEQKIFYILYLDTKVSIGLKKLITRFEEYIAEYVPISGKELSDARKLIQTQFKDFIDRKFKIKK